MALLVQKFGGSSLANIERIQNVAKLVHKAKTEHHDVVVIVSAMAGETDRLIQLARQVSETPIDREYAALLSTGEQVTMTLLAMALKQYDIHATSFTGGQAGIFTCQNYKKARIQWINPEPLLKTIQSGHVPVIAGFQGIDPFGNVTTLGRGGSDTTAVAIAAALQADECQIFTDVEGVFTTDPNVEPNARRLDQITFEEMLELASLGSKVLQIRSVEFAGKYNVPLRVLSSLKPDEGTLITYEKKSQSMEAPLVSGIAFNRYESKITLRGSMSSTQHVSSILADISELGINIDMMIQQVSRTQNMQLTFTVHQDEFTQTLNHFKNARERLGFKSIKGTKNLAKLSLVGAGLKSHPTVASTLFKTLATLGVDVHLMTMSEIKLSVLIESAKLDESVRALHSAFHLDQECHIDESPKPPHIEESSVVYSEN